LNVTELPQLRPTPDRVRETVFNWLRNRIAGAACLDLYAGTGALGFEAASRGASSVVLVEQQRSLVAALRRQAEAFRANTVEIVHADAIQWLRATCLRFDLVFLDPPFGAGLVARSLDLINANRLLRPGGLVYVESESGLVLAAAEFRMIKHGRAGQVQYALLEYQHETEHS
jgi:16S rRNA (guanine966-N2)-methyltransferase